jgi:hypothetical protein
MPNNKQLHSQQLATLTDAAVPTVAGNETSRGSPELSATATASSAGLLANTADATASFARVP